MHDKLIVLEQKLDKLLSNYDLNNFTKINKKEINVND